MMKLTSLQKRVMSYPACIFLCICSAIAVHSFVIPFDFAPGGISGVSTMIQHMTGINSGYFVFLLNLPLVIMSIFLLGLDFTIRSSLAVVTLSVSFIVLNTLNFPTFVTEQSILSAVVGGFISGVAAALTFKMDSTMGGTDFIAAVIYKKKSHINIVWFVFAIDIVIAIVSIFVYQRGIEPAILSIILMFVSSKTCDSIMAGTKSAAKFEIITEKPEIIKQAIYDFVQRGVTLIPVTGAYSGTNRYILLCVVRRREIPHMQSVLRSYDCAFSIQTNVYSVYGNRFGSVSKKKSGL